MELPLSFWYIVVFRNDLPSVESLWSSLQDQVYFTGGGAAGGLWRHQTWSPSWPPSCENANLVRTVRIIFLCSTRKDYFVSFYPQTLLLFQKKIIHFHPKMAWPPATYDVISRNHSNFSQITQIISTVRTTEIELLFSTPRKIKDFRAVEWLGMGGFVCSLFLCSVCSATQLFIN